MTACTSWVIGCSGSSRASIFGRNPLTPLGRSLSETVAVLRSWAYDHIDDIEAARTRYAEKNALAAQGDSQHAR
jgi:hypothetical protein